MESKIIPCCEEPCVHAGTVERVRTQLPPDEQLYDLAELFKIFGDSTRVKILYAHRQADGGEPVRRLPPAAGSEEQQAGKIPQGGQDGILLPGGRPRAPHPGPGYGAHPGMTRAHPSENILF